MAAACCELWFKTRVLEMYGNVFQHDAELYEMDWNGIKSLKWKTFSGCTTWKLRLVRLCMSAHCKLRSHFIVFSICHGTNETKWNLTSQYKSHVEVLCFICLNFDMFVCQESKLKKASSPGDAHLSAWQRAFVARANQLCLENWNIHRAQKMTALYCQLWGCNRPKSWRWADQSNFANCHLHCVGISLFLGAPPLVAHVTNACLHCVLWIQTKQILRSIDFRGVSCLA